jgi:hypothetical protein
MLARRSLVGLVAACLVPASVAWGQAAPTTRIRGAIAAVGPHSLTITERNGATVAIELDEPLTVTSVRAVPLSDIAPGSFIGTAARRGPDGTLVAMEVLVFPEAMRGAGEGHRPWDLEPGSTMTNATVTGVVESNAGRELTLTYKDGGNVVRVPPNTPIVTLVPAERADLKPGEHVFLSASQTAAGTWHTGRITVGKDGVEPPM